MIPEEYGGSGLGLTEATVVMEEINRSGGNAGHCHGQMYNMGTLLRHGSKAQKDFYLPKIASGELRLQSMARDRADHRHRHDQAEDDRGAARATATSSTARRSGSAASSIPT